MTTRRTAGMAAVLALAAVASPAAGQPPAGGAKVDVEAVARAWTARQEKAKSFAVEWVDTITHPKGRISRNRPDGHDPKLGEIPPHDVVFKSERKVYASGEKVRYQYMLQHWSSKRNGPVHEICDTSCDGKTHTTAAYHNPFDFHPPTGVVRKSTFNRDLQPYAVRAVAVALRGMTNGYQLYNPLEYEATGRTVTVDGVRCAELVREWKAQGARSVLLVDPARDFVMVRESDYDRERMRAQVTVSYAANAAAGWAPTGWDYIYIEPTGHVNVSGRARTTRAEVNPPLADELLVCVQPPGVRVVDQTGKEHKQYVVQPDGAPGKKFSWGSSVTYEEMKAAGPDQSRRWWRGPWAAFAGVFAASVGLLGWRAASRARSRRAGP